MTPSVGAAPSGGTSTAGMQTHSSIKRTFPYQKSLPYPTESQDDALQHLEHITTNLYISLAGNKAYASHQPDHSARVPNAVHWTRELHSWFKLKFDMPMTSRIKLTRVFYFLALNQTDGSAVDRYVSTLTHLWSDKRLHALVTPAEVGLDPAPFVSAVRNIIFAGSSSYEGGIGSTAGALTRLATAVGPLFPQSAFYELWDSILPAYEAPRRNTANTLGALSLLPPLSGSLDASNPSKYSGMLPAIFHLWSLSPPRIANDIQVCHILAGIVSAAIRDPNYALTSSGPLSADQVGHFFSKVLSMLGLPMLDSHSRKFTMSNPGDPRLSENSIFPRDQHPVATIIANSLSEQTQGILEPFEQFMNTVEIFCHPSNSGPWTPHILGLIQQLADAVLGRWNRQVSGETCIPESRWLTQEIVERVVSAVSGAIFFGIHSKSRSLALLAHSSLPSLARLSPDTIIPTVLRETYPSIQGLNQPQRILSSLAALSEIIPIMAAIPRYAFHITPLLELVVPCIDGNDLMKTMLAISAVQSAALCVPFVDLSQDVGTGPAMEYIPNAVNLIVESGKSPEYPEELCKTIIESSSYAFEELANAFLTRIFTTLENMPEPSEAERHSIESAVLHSIPNAFLALLSSVSKDIFGRLLNKTITFISNNVVHNAADAFAVLCGSFVRVDPESFLKFFVILKQNIMYEIESNSAGSSRTTLPRDRSLVWYLSILNMTLAATGPVLLKVKDEVLELTLFLHKTTRGQIVYHTANALHHAIVALTSIYQVDIGFVDSGTQPTVQHWGYTPSIDNLKFKWHSPNRQEVEFAVELYTAHTELALSAIETASVDHGSKGLVSTEFNDIVSNNLTYVRTASSAVALLLPSSLSVNESPQISSEETEDRGSTGDVQKFEDEAVSDGDVFMNGEVKDFDLEVSEPIQPAADIDTLSDMDDDGDVDELRKFRSYPTDYFFADNLSDPLLAQLLDLRSKTGSMMHMLYSSLSSNSTDGNSSAMRELLFAIKIWFSDVGYERSAKAESHHRSVYNYERRHFRVPGLRKRLPRLLLARRALIYHLQRLIHNAQPRSMTSLERLLLLDLNDAVLSIYPDVRRNAQSSLYTACKVIENSKSLVIPRLIDSISRAIADGEYKRADGGIKYFGYRSVNAGIKKGQSLVLEFVEIILKAVSADNEDLNTSAMRVFGRIFPDAFKPVLLSGEFSDLSFLDNIKPLAIDSKLESRIQAIRDQESSLKEHTLEIFSKLITLVSEPAAGQLHWRLETVQLNVLSALLPCKFVPLDDVALTKVLNGTLSSNPDIKKISQETLVLTAHKILQRSRRGHDEATYRLASDSATMRQEDADAQVLESGAPGFTTTFLAEMANIDAPKYYADGGLLHPLHLDIREPRPGWLTWDKNFVVNSATNDEITPLDESDMEVLRKFGKSITGEWFRAFLDVQRLEPRPENDHFEITSAYCFGTIIVLISYGVTELTTSTINELVKSEADWKDKHWHKCLAELSFGLVVAQPYVSSTTASLLVPILDGIASDLLESGNLTHDNVRYWKSFLRWSAIAVDYRRLRSVVLPLNEFRITQDTGFRESFQLSMHTDIIFLYGWVYVLGRDQVVENLLANIGHGLQRIRDETSLQLSAVMQASYHESFSSVSEIERSNAAAGSLGTPAYSFTETQRFIFTSLFETVESNRRALDDAVNVAESAYVTSAKAVGMFLLHFLATPNAAAIWPFLRTPVLPMLLHLTNLRDDVELVALLTKLFAQLAGLPYTQEAIVEILGVLKVHIKTASWHQKLRVLMFLQTFYFTNAFDMTADQRGEVIECVVFALSDTQIEVRELAGTLLSNIVRCLPNAERQNRITSILAQFKPVLAQKPQKQTGTDAVRHAAVLAYGALVNAFPYTIPPPVWVPAALASLARQATGGGGAVEKSVKQILSDFKVTRQDSWHLDQLAFNEDQLDALEGVLWKTYFV